MGDIELVIDKPTAGGVIQNCDNLSFFLQFYSNREERLYLFYYLTEITIISKDFMIVQIIKVRTMKTLHS